MAGRFAVRLGSIRGASLLTSTSLISAVVSFVINLITARALGPEGRGAVALVLQLAYIIAPLAGLGYPRAVLRYRGDSSDTADALLSGGRAGVVLVLVVLSPIVAFVYGPWYLLSGFVAFVTVAFQVQRSVAVTERRYRKYFLTFVGYQVSTVLGSIALWSIGILDWQWWAAVYFFPGLAVFAFSFRSDRYSLNLIRLIRANWPYIWSAVSSMVLLRSERLMLGPLVGNGALGIYVVVATATEPLLWIAQSVADTRSATFFRDAGRRDLFRVLSRDFVKFGVAATLGGFAIFWLIEPVFGQEYSQGKALVLPLVIGVVMLAMYRLAAGIALVRSSRSLLGNVEAGLAVTAVAVYFVAISLAGSVGAAWACVLVYSVGFLTLFAIGIRRPVTTESSSGGQR